MISKFVAQKELHHCPAYLVTKKRFKIQINKTSIIKNHACFSHQMEAMILVSSILPLQQLI